MESATNPESGTIAYAYAYEYDDVGNLLRKVDARNVATCFYAGTCSHTGATGSNGYDALNRPLLTNYSDSTEPVTYGYDAANGSTCKNEGRLTSVGNVDSTAAFSCYDAIGRVIASAQTTAGQSYNFSYEYNNDGTLKSQTYDSGREVAYTYDYAGRPLTAGNATVGPTDYLEDAVYAAHGAPSTMELGNGVDETTLFNSRLQPTTIEAFKSASLMKLDFTYHPAGQTTRNNGNVHSQTINRGGSLIASQTYTYDGVNRLDLATEGAPWTRDYTYDAFGNRGLATSGITFDATNNRITGASYDDAGNLTVMANVADAMVYDANNKMTSFSLDSSGLVKTGDYVYDGQGNRVQRMTREGSGPQITTTYVYDAFGKLAAEYSSEAQGASFTRKFRTTDHLGSTRLVTLADGTADPDAGCLDFYPFGERIEDTVGSRTDDCYDGDDAFAQRFTAKERDDESGLDYFSARYYSGATGRFISVDPGNAGAILSHPQTWSAYGYVNNSPLRFVDPSGMACAATTSEDFDPSCYESPDAVQMVQGVFKDFYNFGAAMFNLSSEAAEQIDGTDEELLRIDPLEAENQREERGMVISLAAGMFFGRPKMRRTGSLARKVTTRDPKTLKFSQDSIKKEFSEGGSLESAINGLKSGEIAPDAFPPIRLVEREGVQITIDNRRLYVYQQAGIPIRTVKATPGQIRVAEEQGKFSAGRLGADTIKVRGQ